MSHFSNDLGLDSLDTVEVVMAIEEVDKILLLIIATSPLTPCRNLVSRFQIKKQMRSIVVRLCL